MKGIARILFSGGMVLGCTAAVWAADVEVVEPITVEHNGASVEVVQDSASTPPAPDIVEVYEPESQPEPTRAAEPVQYVEFEEKTQVAQAPAEVWWGNRAVSFRNYIPIDVVATAYAPAAPPREMRWDNIFFDLKKSYLRPEVIAELEEIRMWMQATPGSTVVIESQVCNDSPDAALQRAGAVKRWLVEHGASPTRINTAVVDEAGAAPANRKWCPIVVVGTAP